MGAPRSPARAGAAASARRQADFRASQGGLELLQWGSNSTVGRDEGGAADRNSAAGTNASGNSWRALDRIPFHVSRAAHWFAAAHVARCGLRTRARSSPAVRDCPPKGVELTAPGVLGRALEDERGQHFGHRTDRPGAIRAKLLEPGDKTGVGITRASRQASRAPPKASCGCHIFGGRGHACGTASSQSGGGSSSRSAAQPRLDRS